MNLRGDDVVTDRVSISAGEAERLLTFGAAPGVDETQEVRNRLVVMAET